ncbi:MAG: hypothetical protein MAGBODY4_01741 [Candidatus Marinimicrobia bacterium]|nr:hypothetical protein [Candidatus Neomarinimicrobiota bacterium]
MVGCLRNNRCILFGVWILGFLAAGNLLAASTDSTEFTPLFKPNVIIQRTPQTITIDGNLDDLGWNAASQVNNFSEIQPGDNTAPPVKTTAWITYDQSNLYVAFRAYGNPEEIRVSLRDRDAMFSDDFVGVFLDTYGNQDWAYELLANPLGIQGDGRKTRMTEDMSFDAVFQTKGKITETGYQVEFAIPFRSLRFPAESSEPWRITFYRNLPRDSRHQISWAAIDRDNPCLLCQLGYLKGLEGISPGSNLEFLPEAIVSQRGYLRDDEDPTSAFVNKNVNAETSLGLKYNFSSNSTIDVAVNPDFSQVEADPAHIDVNTTFALSYPERRPFFQEGSDLFETWMDLVYTRSINDPSLATKLTGRYGKTNIAYIGARDERTPIILPFEEQSEFVGGETRIRSVSNIIRVKQNFAEESHVGLLATDRRFDPGGSATVLNADFNHRFLQNYRIRGQFALSQTRETQDTSLTSEIDAITFGKDDYTSEFDGENYLGHALYTELQRDARIWDVDLNYREYSPTFRAGNGFITQNNRHHFGGSTEWEFWPESSWIDRYKSGLHVGYIWNYDNIRKDQWIVPYFNATLIKQTHLNVHYIASRERFQGIDFPGIRRIEMNINSEFSDVMTAGFYVEYGRSIARNEDPPILGKQIQGSVWTTLKPNPQLVIQPELDFSSMYHTAADTTIFAGFILRTRINYQFTRQLFIRFFVQYNDFYGDIDFDPLLTYRINAFSVIYVGTTHDYHDFGTPASYIRTGRQFFLKFRYLIHL